MPSRKSRFGRHLTKALSRRGLRQTDLASRLDVSDAYLSAVSTGRKQISPERIDRIVMSMEFEDDEATDLHRAAAMDAGFKLDLPDDF